MNLIFNYSALEQFAADVRDILDSHPDMAAPMRDHLIGCKEPPVVSDLDFSVKAPDLVVVLKPSDGLLRAVRVAMESHGHRHQPRWASLRPWWPPSKGGRIAVVG